MKRTDVVLFNKNDIRQVLSDFEFKIEKQGKEELVREPSGIIATCHGCKAELTVNRVGTIAHGSRRLFCDNPSCFSSWVAEKRLQ